MTESIYLFVTNLFQHSITMLVILMIFPLIISVILQAITNIFHQIFGWVVIYFLEILLLPGSLL
ncbi:MAG: hypothetical protein OEZ01_16900, partial [Candidatus Heimdallarchaeota archaeon]|nr:hypothetical protein [Candidatus Heimdallarchaeota archaeon]